jgi:hypothetical protein
MGIENRGKRRKRPKRSVGYCLDKQCQDYFKPIFLLNHGDEFSCPRCRTWGRVVSETAKISGRGKEFKEVRVEFIHDPREDVYRCVAIVRDEEVDVGKVYTLTSPLVRTDKRALLIAEATLGNLRRAPDVEEGEVVPSTEIKISFDDSLDDFRESLVRIEKLYSKE